MLVCLEIISQIEAVGRIKGISYCVKVIFMISFVFSFAASKTFVEKIYGL